MAALPHWSAESLAVLHHRLESAPLEALPVPDCTALAAAERAGDGAVIDREASAVAVKMARLIALGWMPAEARAAWHIADSDARIDFAGQLATALGAGTLDAWFSSLEPRRPDYAALRTAYAAETDPARRQTLARNLERWRWMPHDPGAEYLLVNAAAFRVDLWRDGRVADSHRVIVGKVSSPTPVFGATVSGVTFNPWWDIPANIVRESVGRLVARHPKLARQRGYVWGGGRYRQRPGPGNSLGLMKLIMPNSYNVYLHDTPSKSLFERPVRTFSHGCVRVDDALGLAADLLAPTTPREEIDGIVASGRTTDVRLGRNVPIYIAYFTAEATPDGTVTVLPDVYNRDGAMGDAAVVQRLCAF
ncbi:L,D-transpeptidase family protein [Novosphingobium sp. KCTC 2891]|nr:L,D-transpeptidase family protein [Novosphingobium sp. KCTC 2891]